MPTSNYSGRIRAGGILCGFLATLLVLCASAFLMGQSYLNKMQDMLSNTQLTAQELEQEIRTNLVELNQSPSPLTQCSTELLHEMKVRVFNTQHIKEIGWLTPDRQLRCISSLGQLPQGPQIPDPDLNAADGLSVRLNAPLRLFNNERSANIFHMGQFNLVLSNPLLALNDHYPIQQAAAMQTREGDFIFFEGNREAFHTCENGRLHNHLTSTGLFSSDNRLSPLICSSTYVSYADILLAHQGELLFILLVALLIGISVGNRAQLVISRYFSFESRFLRNLHQNNIICLYQPIVDLQKHNRQTGLEVLCRYQLNEAVLTPDVFLPLIRKHNLTLDFTRMMMEKALQELSKYPEQTQNLRVAFNLFSRDFTQANLETLFSRLPDLQAYNFRITVELTEDELTEADEARRAISEMHNRRISVAIDDFGTGYSSLSYLQQLHADVLKIDRSFIQHMDNPSVRTNMLYHIIKIGHDIGTEMVAEGVETVQQVEQLTRMGVDYAQGYYFSRPAPLPECFIDPQEN